MSEPTPPNLTPTREALEGLGRWVDDFERDDLEFGAWSPSVTLPSGVRTMPYVEDGPDGEVYKPFQLHVLDLDGPYVRHATIFFDTVYFEMAGLPPRLLPEDVPARPEA